MFFPGHFFRLLTLFALFSLIISCGGSDTSVARDTDGDGIVDTIDTDDDNDGVEDVDDAFPLDATESVDTDGDGTGDNADTDDDNDGELDVTDLDDDNDGLIEVYNLADLDDMRNHLGGDMQYSSNLGCPVAGCTGFELMNDLDFDTNNDTAMTTADTYYDYDGDNSDNGWLPIGDNTEPFHAIFEGNNHVINNLFINRVSGDAETNGLNIGLFGIVGNLASAFSGEIKNIGLSGDLASIAGRLYAGALVASLDNNSSVINSYANTTMNCTLSGGGLVGTALNNTSISDSYASGSISGGEVGGLVGSTYNNVTITDSYATNSVSANTTYVGGLISYTQDDLTLTNSYATGDVTSGASGTVGGLIGDIDNNDSTVAITNCYATGNVSGDDYVGGLIGYMDTNPGNATRIKNSYATGNVTGVSDAGGLIGRASSVLVSSSYATGNVIAPTNAGGLVGSTGNSDVVISASYATGSVTAGTTNAGGLIGNVIINTEINASYATGAVIGTNTGGLIGNRDTAVTINETYWASDSTGQNNLAGSGAGVITDNNTFAALLTDLQCPVSADTTGCVAANGATELYTGWDAIDDDNDGGTASIAPWKFGSNSQLPGFSF